MDYKKIAEDNTILRVLVGSQAYGLNLDDQGDRDEKGVCIEPYNVFAGFNGFEQYEFRSAVEREGKHDAKSGPGDLDLTIYSLKKFLKLALKGNPTIIEMLFLEDPNHRMYGLELQDLAPYLISRQAGRAYLGYLQAQRRKMEAGYDAKGMRAEGVYKFGYDTKFAMHALRLGIQGVELLETGKLQFPLTSYRRDYLLAVRKGAYTLGEISEFVVGWEGRLKQLIDHASPLPEQPNHEVVEEWMLDTYRYDWHRKERSL